MSAPYKQWFRPDTEETSSVFKCSPNAVLARGAFGSVSFGIFQGTTGAIWKCTAIKAISSDGSSANTSKFFQSNTNAKNNLSHETFHEVCALRLLNPHCNIIDLWWFSQSANELEVAFPYRVDLGTTLEWRRQQRKTPFLLPRAVVRGIAWDLFSALEHCHAHGVLHLDVKPGNLLVDTSSGHMQLCDFGLATPFEINAEKDDNGPPKKKEEAAKKGLCTLYYRPPENILRSQTVAPASDVYSAAVVLGELLAGFPLFRGTTDLGQLQAIFQCLGTPVESSSSSPAEPSQQLPDFMNDDDGSSGAKLNFSSKQRQKLDSLLPRAKESPHLLPLLERLLVLNPTVRPSASNVLGDAYFTTQTTTTIDRSTMQRELVPGVLREPVILSNPHNDVSVATKKASSMVAARKAHEKSLQKWAGANKPFRTCKTTFQSTIYCAAKSAIVAAS
ncbi:Mitogen-activated protein kinase HOG1 (Fragment) [Seminavis robusta]|uniref:Mitogen-activated protein kinase HOG1 n=1 Tax=Seminavis robusta TaxID=568900 RepID=A0A9N8EJZ4_9STRA